ncbi:MAG: hypothetical protein R3E95_02295 [Thiolinea sp.]
MYENKKLRMGSYNFYYAKETLIKKQRDAQLWNKIIDDTLRKSRLTPYFQAIIKTSDQEIFMYEVLSRITDQHGKVVYHPGEYINDNYLITKMDKYIIESIINGAENNEKALNLLEHVTALAKALEIAVIAEGVEIFSFWYSEKIKN